MEQVQMRKRKRGAETGGRGLDLEMRKTVAAASYTVQEKLAAWDIEEAAPVADLEWQDGCSFRQAFPFSNPHLVPYNTHWDVYLNNMESARYIEKRTSRERGLILKNPDCSMRSIEYTAFLLGVAALIQQGIPRQSVGVVTASYDKYEQFERIYRKAYCAPEVQRSLRTCWINPSRLESDFFATQLNEDNFIGECELTLALAHEEENNAEASSSSTEERAGRKLVPTETDWKNALPFLVDDAQARAIILYNLAEIKTAACAERLGRRAVFDPDVPLPLASHPLLLPRQFPSNFYSMRFDALLFLDFPETIAELVTWGCLCGTTRLVVGNNLDSMSVAPYATALAGMKVYNESELTFHVPLSAGSNTPIIPIWERVKLADMSRLSVRRSLLQSKPYEEALGNNMKNSDAWIGIEKFWKSLNKHRPKKKRRGRIATGKAISRQFPRVNNAGDLLTVLCENMIIPTSRDVRESFGCATHADIQLRMQHDFARSQYFQMTSVFGHPDTWVETSGWTQNSRCGLSPWRELDNLFGSLAFHIDEETRIPMGVQHIIRRLCSQGGSGGSGVLLLMPAMQDTVHSLRPFHASMRNVRCIEVTSEIFQKPDLLVAALRKEFETDAPACVLAYTPLALSVNPALVAHTLLSMGHQTSVSVFCQADSLESVLMDFVMEAIAGQLEDDLVIDPATLSRQSMSVYTDIALLACRTFAQKTCSNGIGGAYMPRELLRDAWSSLEGNTSETTSDLDIGSVLRSGDVTESDALRSATLCGFNRSDGRPPTYDEMAMHLQRAERRSCYEDSKEVRADMAAMPSMPHAWTFAQLSVASHRGAGIERILQQAGIPEHVTCGYFFRGQVSLPLASRVMQTPWFGLPSSITHELSRVAIHRSAYTRSSGSSHSAPWWSQDVEDADRMGWGNSSPTVLMLSDSADDTEYMKRARELRTAAIRRAVTMVREQAPNLEGEARLRRVNAACEGWAAHANSSLRVHHAAQLLTEAQVRKNAATFIRYDIERTKNISLEMRAAIKALLDVNDERNSQWFVRTCIDRMRAIKFGMKENVIERVPHELDTILVHADRAIDLVSVLMPGPQRQAQIGQCIRVPGRDAPSNSLLVTAYENTLWFVTSSLEHDSPLMEMLYNYAIVLTRDMKRTVEVQSGISDKTDPEAQLASDIARALGGDEKLLEQPAHVREEAAQRFQELAAAATAAADREARGESEPVVTAQTVSIRSGQLQRPSDFMNVRFLQTTGAIFGKKRLRAAIEQATGCKGDAETIIRMLYKRAAGAGGITFFSLSNNAQRASYFERAKLTMVFRIMLNSMLDPDRPRMSPEFAEHAMPFLKSQMLLGVTARTRKLITPALDDLVSDMDACHYLSLPPEMQTCPEDPEYGDPETDPAFDDRMRRLAILCPRFVRLLIRDSIGRCVERVRPAWEAHKTQMLAVRRALDSRSNHANSSCKN